MAHVGIIDLAAKGYTAGAYAMIVVFGVSLIVRAIYYFATKKSSDTDGTAAVTEAATGEKPAVES